MANTFKLKRTAVSGRRPTAAQLDLGELAVNTYDGKLFLKKNAGGAESIVEIGQQTGGGGGGPSYIKFYRANGQPRPITSRMTQFVTASGGVVDLPMV